MIATANVHRQCDWVGNQRLMFDLSQSQTIFIKQKLMSIPNDLQISLLLTFSWMDCRVLFQLVWFDLQRVMKVSTSSHRSMHQQHRYNVPTVVTLNRSYIHNAYRQLACCSNFWHINPN